MDEPRTNTDATGQPGVEQPAAYREYLFRFAMMHLHDPARAEDAVQETLLAAVESRAAFSGRAQLRTWLTGILKHKIIDGFRRQAREAPLDEVGESDEEFSDRFFDPQDRDHWRSFPGNWGDPEKSLESKRFWEVFDACSKAMPAQTARVFAMRELMGLETEEICKELGITANNCWVMLYRARMSLRQCLEARWFQQAP
jgi:RNA polymerase sigma-70 factor (ECF subfamily)